MRKTFVTRLALGVALTGAVFYASSVWAGGTETPPGSGNWVVDSAEDTGVIAAGGTSVLIDAEGSITTLYNGVTINSDGYTITNDGTIAADGYGIVSGSNNLTVINNGTITGGDAEAAVSFCHSHGGEGDDALTNAGTINGDIEMGYGDDTITLEEGSVTNGDIMFSYGNDQLIVNGAAEVNDNIYFGKDDDTLQVNEGTFTFSNDIYMGSGDDTITVKEGATFTFDDDDDVMAAGDDTFNIYGTVNGYLAGGPDADTFNFYSGAQVNDDICGGDGTEHGENIDTVNLYGSGTYDYHMEYMEYLNKYDDGTWVLTGLTDSGYIGEIYEGVTIHAGTLQVDGEISTYLLSVESDGVLSGGGTVTGHVTNSGSINPGSAGAIGTLTIGLDYTQTADGDLTINVNALESDRLNVLGTASLDGTLTIVPTSDIADGSSYTIFTATEYSGEFAELIENSALLNFTLEYTSTTVELLAERSSELVPFAQTRTQEILAAQLDELIQANEIPDVASFFYALSEEEITEALDDVSPAQYAAMADAASTGSSVYRSALTGRMNNLHSAFQNPAQGDNISSNTLTEDGPVLARQPAFQRTGSGWSSWARILGQTADQDGDMDNNGFQFDTYGLSLGADKDLNDNFVIGLSAGYLDTDIDYDNPDQSGDVETFHIGVYGTYSAPKLYVDMALTYSHNEYDSKRAIPLASVIAAGNTDGNDYTAYVGFGYSLIDRDNWYLIPTLSLEYSRVDVDSFTEKGAGDLNFTIDDYDSDSVVSSLGGRIGMKTKIGETAFEPELSLEWAHEYGDLDRDVKARFAGTNGSVTIPGVEPERDSLLVGVDLNFYLTDKITIGVDYNGEFRSDFDAHQISADFRYYF